jgi:hypothetical protein
MPAAGICLLRAIPAFRGLFMVLMSGSAIATSRPWGRSARAPNAPVSAHLVAGALGLQPGQTLARNHSTHAAFLIGSYESVGVRR